MKVRSMILVGSQSSRHTTLFQRSFNVIWTLKQVETTLCACWQALIQAMWFILNNAEMIHFFSLCITRNIATTDAKYEKIRKWTYAELRDVINTSCGE